MVFEARFPYCMANRGHWFSSRSSVSMLRCRFLPEITRM